MPGKFDALKIPVNEPKRMTIVHPATKEPLRDSAGKEAFIELLSIDSEVARKRRNDTQRKRSKMQDRSVSPEDFETEVTGLFAELTKDWYLLGLDGEQLGDIPCDAENAKELYGLQELSWIRSQVDGFVGNISNWAPKAAAKGD